MLRLRLGHGLPQRAVAQSLRLSQEAVNSYMVRARRAGLGWPLPEGLDDTQLERLLYPPLADWIAAHVSMMAFFAGVPRQITQIVALHHRHQRLLGGPARLKESREVAALPQLRDTQLQAAQAGVQGICASSVTGPQVSSPKVRDPVAGIVLLSGVGARPPPDGV